MTVSQRTVPDRYSSSQKVQILPSSLLLAPPTTVFSFFLSRHKPSLLLPVVSWSWVIFSDCLFIKCSLLLDLSHFFGIPGYPKNSRKCNLQPQACKVTHQIKISLPRPGTVHPILQTKFYPSQRPKQSPNHLADRHAVQINPPFVTYDINTEAENITVCFGFLEGLFILLESPPNPLRAFASKGMTPTPHCSAVLCIDSFWWPSLTQMPFIELWRYPCRVSSIFQQAYLRLDYHWHSTVNPSIYPCMAFPERAHYEHDITILARSP
ncbi:hypothetical protein HOLleu_27969 [Holothuria leucospilota]|uniref:Uncharacterized protein n=1 Tax=Holothuria leucospilota TaxID=206669 RepID=A0A9Q1BR59_HOLLE|nr:hypothetical protein HOLleu_27969 [Holothuria leucospilota]